LCIFQALRNALSHTREFDPIIHTLKVEFTN
jgi:hypothetical protein